MTDAERQRLAETRRLIFKNLANGVVVEKVMAAFGLSEKEVLDHFRFVARKIWGYRFERGMPYIKVETPADARCQVAPLLHTLKRIGPVSLTSDHKFSHEVVVPIDGGEAKDRIEYLDRHDHRPMPVAAGK